jgi:hypothetical protein
MILSDLRDLLLSITPDVYHYHAHKKPNKYIVWAEDREAGSSNADNQKDEQVLQGTIDYFTKMEFDPNFDLIQNKLNSCEISWRLNSIQYEDDTGYIHYEWVWEMI